MRKPSLYITVEAIRKLVRDRRWQLAYRAVPRALNTHADDICRRAERAGAVVEFMDGSLPDDAPALDVAALYSAVES